MTPEELKELRKSNLRQNKKLDYNPEIPAELKDIIHKHILVTLSGVELFIYFDELREWTKSHPEWNTKEDKDDLNAIAMEKVIQFRLLMEKRNKKTADIDKNYTASKNREQAFRTNLGAKRSTRVLEKANVTNNNIVLLTGKMEDENIKKLLEVNNREQIEEDELFKVIDVEKI